MWSSSCAPGLLFILFGLIRVNKGQDSTVRRSRGCSSTSGKPCIFPFFYNGTLYDGEKIEFHSMQNPQLRAIFSKSSHRQVLLTYGHTCSIRSIGLKNCVERSMAAQGIKKRGYF